MKKLYFLFTLVILLNLPFSCVKDPDVKVEQIEVSESNSISATWINFNGYFTIKYALPQKCYICIGQNKDLSDGVQYPFQNTYYNNTTFLYNYTVSSLIANTTYYYKFIFKNGDYQYETDIKEIKTVNYQLSTITTKEATNITLTSAISGGNISDAGLGEVSQRGICWSVTPNPTLDNSFTMDGVGTGDYSSIMANLTTHTTYYVRAYAINNAGVTYGNQMIFTTLDLMSPTVVTKVVDHVSANTAQCGGEITFDGGASITERGVCWSTSPNPTTANDHSSDGNGYGSFVSTLTGLNAHTTYYVRAYATNSIGTSYGEERQFMTLSN